MNLHRVRLENFRQHASTEIEFGLGMTAIIGPNGAGKSTLVEAIGFALYGEQRDKKETVRFHWATGKRFLVRLEFSLGDRRFVVQRTDRDASLVQLGEPEIVRAEGLAETTRACERGAGASFPCHLRKPAKRLGGFPAAEKPSIPTRTGCGRSIASIASASSATTRPRSVLCSTRAAYADGVANSI